MLLVSLTEHIADAIVDMRYTGGNNIAHKPISAESNPRLTATTAKRLQKAANDFRDQGLRLVIWDAFRPLAVQRQLLLLMHDERYIRKDSNHCLGKAVDITLAKIDGTHLDMGTDHDDFTHRAHVKTTDLNPEQVHNRDILAAVMQRHGFTQWPYEWWHFDYEQ
jgi:D-alanyl-D-alanine dipeptidase